jgi:lipopolysaccharide transport system ATP-binding protein
MSIAVRIEDLSKEYRIGVINNGSLYKDIQSAWARIMGRDDPHSVIGEKNRFDKKGSFWALKDISLDVLEGQRIGIIGRNGAGKSTLLKILSRITAPTTGCVKIKGRVASLLEVGTGFHPELTGRENTFLNGAILGMTKKEIARKFDEIVAFSEIEPFIDTPVKRYSSGMFVRLAFSVAAHLDAEILIADEVLTVGDIKFQQKSLGKMQEVSEKQGRTVIFVSHNAGAVQTLCTVGVLIENGKMLDMESDVSAVIKCYNKLIGIG